VLGQATVVVKVFLCAWGGGGRACHCRACLIVYKPCSLKADSAASSVRCSWEYVHCQTRQLCLCL
jgi:hypothetical protein